MIKTPAARTSATDAEVLRLSPSRVAPAPEHHLSASIAHPGGARRTETEPLAREARVLWNPASGRFDPALLRAAILARGWTVREFAGVYGGGRSTFYNVIRGFAPNDRTVLRVHQALAIREPTVLVDG